MLYGYKKASIHTKFHEEEDDEIGDQTDTKQPQAEFQFSQHGATAPGFHALPFGMAAKGEGIPGYLGTPQQGKDASHKNKMSLMRQLMTMKPPQHSSMAAAKLM